MSRSVILYAFSLRGGTFAFVRAFASDILWFVGFKKHGYEENDVHTERSYLDVMTLQWLSFLCEFVPIEK